jgi:hypothetical protein
VLTRPARLTLAQASPRVSRVMRGLPLSHTVINGLVPPVSSVSYLKPRLWRAQACRRRASGP